MDEKAISTIIEIKDNLVQFWMARDVRIKAERRMIALTEPRKVKGFVSVTINDPKVMYDTSVALLSGFDPRIRLPLTNQPDEEKDKMNKAERFLIGVIRELDRKQALLGRDSVLRELAYYVCSGWYSVFPYISEADGVPEFNIIFYDPMTVYPQWGSRGL